jgi:translation initiation factor 2 beta subunit (eIF-2beta)/eIF-5
MPLKLTTQQVITRINVKFPQYKLVKKPDAKDDGLYVTLKCAKHGQWTAKASRLLQTKHGCPTCKDAVIGDAISASLTSEPKLVAHLAKHAARLVYVKRVKHPDLEYRRLGALLKCTVCGVKHTLSFSDAMRIRGCPSCQARPSARGGRSEICNNWLGELQRIYGIDIQGFSSKEKSFLLKSGKRMRVDGFHSDSQTVFEFLGDYWHGNPKNQEGAAAKQRYENTIQRLLKLSRKYNVIYVWEQDYKLRGMPLSGFLGNGPVPFML